MGAEYIAHISNSGQEQTVAEHSLNTASLAERFSIDEFKQVNYLCGLLHDIGKFSNEFQKKIRGENVKVEHSICGAKEVESIVEKNTPIALLMQLCIAGHHSGIPDCGTRNDSSDMSTLHGRLKRNSAEYSKYSAELDINKIDTASFKDLLIKDCRDAKDLIEKFAFFVRYCFSCLTDADSLDTCAFCREEMPEALRCNFEKCEESINKRMSEFKASKEVTKLQAARSSLQEQAFSKINTDSNIYLMNMPTGSGKTLAGMRCALKRMRKANGNIKRIIYVIPYNSIIDQTAATFEDLFSEHTDILRHQSTFVYEEQSDLNEDDIAAFSAACENWDAGIIITTSVQFFESLYGNKRGKLRKLHNMANSIIVFDEAHLMPKEYLEPCLRGISYITKYLGSEAIFLTATMPDYRTLFEQCCEKNLSITELIDDTSEFEKFSKCRFFNLGSVSDEEILQKSSVYASSLIVVNSKKKAAELYKLCSGKKYHLSTYMTGFDRKRVIDDIRLSLKSLYAEYSDLSIVPPERRITVISTSLIEAGVDLDFVAAFRELAGLDSILQTGGRCNREGKREPGDVFIYESSDSDSGSFEKEITRGILDEYDDISCEEAINSYYNRLNLVYEEKIHSKNISKYCTSIDMIPFRTYSEEFRLIDNKRTVSIVVCRDRYSKELYDKLCVTGHINGRKISNYCCTVYINEFELLRNQGVLNDNGSGIFFLTVPSYYDNELGIRFEGTDFII